MANKNLLIIQGSEHDFYDLDGLLKVANRVLDKNPRMTYCRHVGFRFVIPKGLSAMRSELGEELSIEFRYVDESHQWGKFYSPRQFVVGEHSIPLYSGDSMYLSEVPLTVDILELRLKQARFGKENINLVGHLNLNEVISVLREKAKDNAGEIAAAWDYNLLRSGLGTGFILDKYNNHAGKVDHHLSSFRGVPLIYIPLNKLFADSRKCEMGLKYLKEKFTRAKEEGVLDRDDVQALIIEAEPEPRYKL